MRLTRLPAATAAGALALLLGAAACDYKPEIAPQFVASGTGSVQGQLFFDADANGRFNPVEGDTLLRGVPIQVRNRGTTQVIASTTTDQNGRFSLTGIPVGTHDFFAVANSGVTGTLVFCTNPARASVLENEQIFLSVAAKRGCVVRISDAEAQPVNSVVTVAGIVTVTQGAFNAQGTYVQDLSGGIQLFRVPTTLNLQAGDSIEVTGTLVPQSATTTSELELTNVTVSSVKRGATPIVPQVIDLPALVAATSNSPLIGRLVTLRKVHIGTLDANRNAPLTNATGGGGGALFRVETNLAGTITQSTIDAASCYDVTGITSFFGSPQIKPRGLSDFVKVPCS